MKDLEPDWNENSLHCWLWKLDFYDELTQKTKWMYLVADVLKVYIFMISSGFCEGKAVAFAIFWIHKDKNGPVQTRFANLNQIGIQSRWFSSFEDVFRFFCGSAKLLVEMEPQSETASMSLLPTQDWISATFVGRLSPNVSQRPPEMRLTETQATPAAWLHEGLCPPSDFVAKAYFRPGKVELPIQA